LIKRHKREQIRNCPLCGSMARNGSDPMEMKKEALSLNIREYPPNNTSIRIRLKTMERKEGDENGSTQRE